jgi:hypothetical protein
MSAEKEDTPVKLCFIDRFLEVKHPLVFFVQKLFDLVIGLNGNRMKKKSGQIDR